MTEKHCLSCGDVIDNPIRYEGFCTTACYQKYHKQKNTKTLPPLPPEIEKKLTERKHPHPHLEK